MSSPQEQEDILYAFAVEPVHNKATLERYVKQYPELTLDFIDLLSEIRYTEFSALNNRDEIPDPGFEAAWKELIAIKRKDAP